MKPRRPADNPFAAHRVEALPFRSDRAEISDIAGRIEEMGGRAAIVGPEGSGKTTLLEELAGLWGRGAVVVRLPGSCPRPWRTAREQLPHRLDNHLRFLIDGCEQLGVIGWLRVRAVARRARSLVVTLHHPGRLPTVFECRTDPKLLRELVSELAPEDFGDLDPILEELFSRHDGNIRLCLRELYDLFAGRVPESS
jgi:hypothetical protein